VRVIRLNGPAQKPVLVQDTAPQLQPGRGEVLSRVWAAGVTPTELLWYPTSHTKSGECRVGTVPGHEFSGAIEGTGENVGGLELGLEVFGMNDWFSNGAMAEYCVAPFDATVCKPFGLSHAEAASVPISALTAWPGLFEPAKTQAGERVLVHGAAGAVGAYAVQLVCLRGAHVAATASGAGVAFVKELGAEQVIDYRTSRFEHCVNEMDVVFDSVGGDPLRRSWSVLKSHGRMVTIAAGEENTTDASAKEAFFIVEPNQKQLTALAGLLQSRQIRPFVSAVVPMSGAPEAYAGKIPRRQPGKVVVTVADTN
jgi:NADPH:quinone reductase-like Zn-dependent oxidoreductase